MRDIFLVIFSLGILISVVGGFVGLISPSVFRIGKMAKDPSRRRIAAVTLAAFAVSLVGGVMASPTLTPEEKAKAELAARKAEQEEKARVALAAKQAADAKAAKAEAAKQKANDNLATAINAIRISDRLCAKSVAEVGDRSKSARDRYALYGVVKNAADNCLQAAEDLAKINVPKDIEKARELCVEGELTRAMALSQGAALLDAGTGSPSELQKVEDGIADGQAKILGCMGILVVFAHKAGIEIGDIK